MQEKRKSIKLLYLFARKNAPKKEAIKPVANFKLETPSAW
jgi:hypothetical protein